MTRPYRSSQSRQIITFSIFLSIFVMASEFDSDPPEVRFMAVNLIEPDKAKSLRSTSRPWNVVSKQQHTGCTLRKVQSTWAFEAWNGLR